MRSGKISILAIFIIQPASPFTGDRPLPSEPWLAPRSAGGVSFVSRIVLRVLVFEAQRPNGRYLSDVLAGLCPVEVPRIAGQNDDAAGWIRLDLVAVEPIAQADVEDTGHDRIDSVLGVLMRHEFHARGHLDPDHVRSGLGRLSNKHGQSGRRRERWKRPPVDVF